MQLRMVARRSPAGSVTMLGDLVQASGPWAPATWQEVTEHLATPARWRLAELGLGYRAPADVIELASRLLPIAAPNVTPTRPVRTRRGGVTLVDVTAVDGGVAAAVGVRTAVGTAQPSVRAQPSVWARRVSTARQRFLLQWPWRRPSWWPLTGPWPSSRLKGASMTSRQCFGRRGSTPVAPQTRPVGDRAVTLVEARQAKGLEFDAVVVSDPAAIVASAPTRRVVFVFSTWRSRVRHRPSS